MWFNLQRGMGIIYVVYLLGIITKRGEKQKDIAMFERVGRAKLY